MCFVGNEGGVITIFMEWSEIEDLGINWSSLKNNILLMADSGSKYSDSTKSDKLVESINNRKGLKPGYEKFEYLRKTKVETTFWENTDRRDYYLVKRLELLKLKAMNEVYPENTSNLASADTSADTSNLVSPGNNNVTNPSSPNNNNCSTMLHLVTIIITMLLILLRLVAIAVTMKLTLLHLAILTKWSIVEQLVTWKKFNIRNLLLKK